MLYFITTYSTVNYDWYFFCNTLKKFFKECWFALSKQMASKPTIIKVILPYYSTILGCLSIITTRQPSASIIASTFSILAPLPFSKLTMVVELKPVSSAKRRMLIPFAIRRFRISWFSVICYFSFYRNLLQSPLQHLANPHRWRCECSYLRQHWTHLCEYRRTTQADFLLLVVNVTCYCCSLPLGGGLWRSV